MESGECLFTLAHISAKEYYNLKVDGIAGRVTKGKMSETRNDFQPDTTRGSLLQWPTGTTVRYWVGVNPGYLDRPAVLDELARAFDAWSEVTAVKFQHVQAEAEADVHVQWVDLGLDQKLAFDGPGGELANAGKVWSACVPVCPFLFLKRCTWARKCLCFALSATPNEDLVGGGVWGRRVAACAKSPKQRGCRPCGVLQNAAREVA